MKIVAMVLAGLLIFAASLVGLLAATGNLNAEALARLSGKQVEGKAALPDKMEGTDSLADENRKRQAELDEREQKLAEREKQLAQREKELADLRTQIESMKSEVTGALDNAEQDRATQLEAVANTIQQMKPEPAAERLEKFTVEDQAAILAKFKKPKDSAKVLEAMKPDVAARVMMFMQNKSAS